VKRRVSGLSQAALPTTELPDGVYLVQIERVRYVWDKQKPSYSIWLRVREPNAFGGSSFSSRLWSTPKALWKLSWFLRDFGYDTELLGRDEINEERLAGLTGIVKISHAVVNGRTYLNLDAFAPASRWDEVNTISGPASPDSEVA
jgi:hypothetical protein